MHSTAVGKNFTAIKQAADFCQQSRLAHTLISHHMKNATLQFQTLAQLARFVKSVSPASYIIDTQQLTLRAPLSSLGLAVAIEKNGAVEIEVAPAQA